MRVVSEAETPPTVELAEKIEKWYDLVLGWCEYDYRDPTDRNLVVLYVPDESMEAYRQADYWCDFGEIRPMSQFIEEERAGVRLPDLSLTCGDDLRVESRGESLHIEVTQAADVTVITTSGATLWTGHVNKAHDISLPHGLYIITSEGRAVKHRH